MKEVDVTYTCDATGDEIHDSHEMLVVEVVTPDTLLSHKTRSEDEYHISTKAHSVEYDRNQNRFVAYIGDSGAVAMIEEHFNRGERYYGKDADDESIAHLIELLTDIVTGEIHSDSE